MIDDLLNQLHSADPNHRRQAIMALANTQDPAVLPHLADIYRNDPDPLLRDLALKAGRYIRQASDDGQPSGEPPPISERDQEMAKGYLESAIGFHTRGDHARAVENLGKALSINPALPKETYVANLIVAATGLGVEFAVPMLTHPDRRAAFIEQLGGKSKLKKKQTHGKGAEKATWENVLIDFGIFTLVVALAVIAVMVFSISTIEDTANDAPSSLTSSQLDTLYTASIIFIIVFAIFTGLATSINVLVQGAAVHVAATTVFGGDGTLVYLYRRLVPFQTIIMFISAAVFVFMTLTGSPEVLCFLLPMSLAGGTIVYYYWLSKLIGEVYNFGAGSGCGALLIGSILLGALSFAGQYVLISILEMLFKTAT
jgi:hypothetical protein